MGDMPNGIPVLIPAYEPDARIIELLKALMQEEHFVLIVDDGSGKDYLSIFDEARSVLGNNGTVLSHAVNKGKGAALKTGFKWIIDNMPDSCGCVTADCDGQHSPGDINKVMSELREYPDSLILGCRQKLADKDVPVKSRIGYKLMSFTMRFLGGVKVTDSQTGLRGIPVNFMSTLLEIEADRFEFEMEMLLKTNGRLDIREVPIETIYDSVENHQTHFKAVKDSIKIAGVLGRYFIRFIFASLASTLLDISLFAIFSYILKKDDGLMYIAAAAILARVISAAFNYLVNGRYVFKTSEDKRATAPKYFLLAVCIMLSSAGLTTFFVWLLPFIPSLVVKILVDTTLFLVSYKVQKELIFR